MSKQKIRWDWDFIQKKLTEYVDENGKFHTIKAVSDWSGIPYGTLYDAFKFEKIRYQDFITHSMSEEEEEIPSGLTAQVNGNSATLKFKGGEPLSPEDLISLAGLDEDEWTYENDGVKINAWQIGRKSKEVDMTFEEGRVSGRLKDSGEIKKEYLFKIEVKLRRKNPVAVSPVIVPVQIDFQPVKYFGEKDDSGETILFITDPHFGYLRVDQKLVPFQVRHFIGSLLEIAKEIQPDLIVWGGDILDLPGFSRFQTEPSIMFQTQKAIIEASWVLGQFRLTTNRQVVLEGNHDKRLNTEIIKNVASAYELRPADQLDGFPVMSIPKLLGLESIFTEWVGGYPNSDFRFGDIIFSHGNIARKGSGKTVSNIVNDATISSFFGHIHRHEVVTKLITDSGKEIVVGSPGCAADRRVVPGSSSKMNWHIGAFLITTDGTDVVSLEHIRGSLKDETFFRSVSYHGNDYFDQMLSSLSADALVKLGQ